MCVFHMMTYFSSKLETIFCLDMFMIKLHLARGHQVYSVPLPCAWKAKFFSWKRNYLHFEETWLSCMDHWKQVQQLEKEGMWLGATALNVQISKRDGREECSTSLVCFVSWNTVYYPVAILYAGKCYVVATLYGMLCWTLRIRFCLLDHILWLKSLGCTGFRVHVNFALFSPKWTSLCLQQRRLK